MAHTTRVVIIVAIGQRAYASEMRAESLMKKGVVHKIKPRLYIVLGLENRTWQGVQSGHAGPTVMQLAALRDRRMIGRVHPVHDESDDV